MYIMIINPQAGQGKGKVIYEYVRSSPIFNNEKIDYYISRYKGHIAKIVHAIEHSIAKGLHIKALIVVGGDGTVHEVINAITNPTIKLAHIPTGSGNDFSRGINLPRNLNKLLQTIAQSDHEKKYWPSTYSFGHYPCKKFVNCIGFGFDAKVAKRANQLKQSFFIRKFRLHKFVYVFALLRELFNYKPKEIVLKINGVEKSFKNLLFLVVNNHPYFGGGMKINPMAKNNDKTLSLLVVDSIPKWKILLFFVTVFFGFHTSFKEVKTYTSTSVEISSQILLPTQIDGEYSETHRAKIAKSAHYILIKGSPI